MLSEHSFFEIFFIKKITRKKLKKKTGKFTELRFSTTLILIFVVIQRGFILPTLIVVITRRCAIFKPF